jgi:hypothetical protein
MSIAMTIVWTIVGGFGLPFAIVASVVLTITWFVVKSQTLAMLVAALFAVMTVAGGYAYYSKQSQDRAAQDGQSIFNGFRSPIEVTV